MTSDRKTCHKTVRMWNRKEWDACWEIFRYIHGIFTNNSIELFGCQWEIFHSRSFFDSCLKTSERWPVAGEAINKITHFFPSTPGTLRHPYNYFFFDTSPWGYKTPPPLPIVTNNSPEVKREWSQSSHTNCANYTGLGYYCYCENQILPSNPKQRWQKLPAEDQNESTSQRTCFRGETPGKQS